MKNKPYPYYHNKKIFTLNDYLLHCVSLYGNSIAFSFMCNQEKKSKTYSEFYYDVNAFGAYLFSTYGSGNRFVLLGENSYEWIVSYFATAITGNIIVPLDCNLSADDTIRLFSETNAKLFLCSDNYDDYADKLRESIDNSDIIMMSEILSTIIPENIKNYSLNKCIKPLPQNICTILFTSGTTGNSKGVMLSHQNICSSGTGGAQLWRGCGKTIHSLPLYHAYGFGCALICSMFWGTEIFINNSLKTFNSELLEIKPDFLFTVPLVVETFFRNIRQSNFDKKNYYLKLSISKFLLRLGIDVREKFFRELTANFGGNLKSIVVGGSSFSSEVHSFFEDIGIHIMAGYGITECSPLISVNRNNHFKYGSVGLPHSMSEIKIDSPSQNIPGEITVKGSVVMNKYFNSPSLTEKAFSEGYFRTGDIGYVDKDGFLFITGRKKNVIILSNGKNIFPEELEADFIKYSSVKEVTVYEKDGSVVAEVYPDNLYLAQNDITNYKSYFQSICDDFNKNHPPYKSIHSIILRDTEFPKTTSMKIKRQAKEKGI